jgi:hypothetical protein
MQYQIEKGVTMPERGNLRREKSPLRLAFEQMEVGDSVVLPEDLKTSPHPMAQQVGIKVAMRRQPDGATRVWRVA